MVGVEDGHAVDRAGFVGAGGRIDHVVGADDERHIGLAEFAIDFFQIEDLVVRHAGFGEQHVHVTRHAPGNRVDGKFHLDPGFFEQRRHFPHLVLRMGHCHAVTRHDDDLAGVAHHGGSVDGTHFLHRAGNGFTTAGGHHRRKQDVGQRPVHGLGHQLRQQGAGSADDDTGDDQRRIAQDVALETHSQTGEGIEQRDHHRHVGAADGQGDDQAEQQGNDEEGDHQFRLLRRQDHHRDAQTNGSECQYHIDRVLRRQTPGFLEHALQLGPGDAGAGEGDRADECAKHGENGGDQAMHFTLGKFDGGNRGSGAAAHAVVDGNHLRHVGHLHFFAGNPGQRATDDQRQQHQAEIEQAGNEEHRGNGDQHAVTGDDDAAPGAGRRAHALQAEDEEQRADEPGALHVNGNGHV